MNLRKDLEQLTPGASKQQRLGTFVEFWHEIGLSRGQLEIRSCEARAKPARALKRIVDERCMAVQEEIMGHHFKGGSDITAVVELVEAPFGVKSLRLPKWMRCVATTHVRCATIINRWHVQGLCSTRAGSNQNCKLRIFAPM
jgi:hypothetical protein